MSKQTVTHAHPSGSFWARNRKSGGYLLRKTVRRKGYQLIRFLLLFGLCFMIIQPLLDKLSVSFMAERDLYDSTVISIPRHLTTANYSLAASKILLNYGTTFLNTLIVNTLHEAGYKNVVHFDNGKDAWDYVNGHRELGGNILDQISCVISDIEMPKMDGHHLTKMIKDDPILKAIPVYLFSSLINEQMRIKGESVGADGQFSKPQIGQLIQYLDEHI